MLDKCKPYVLSPVVSKTTATAIKMPIKDAEYGRNDDSSTIFSGREVFFISVIVALTSFVAFVAFI